MKYRPDIDGLRAIAVLPVVLFHAGFTALPGGFVGVDIFFVISGYLISSIILGEMARGDFSFARFYERRIRRIIPALLAMLAATLGAGYFFLLPDEYASLGQATLAALAFVPNVYFWDTESTYFGLDIATQPLLHTWSLGVEEQFYILFPGLLYLLHRLASRRVMVGVMVLLFVLSLGINIMLVALYTKFTFYMLPTRAWELLAGVLLSLGILPPLRRHLAEGAAWLGLALVAGTMLLLGEQALFPGINAVYPVIGAALIIHAGRAAPTRVSRLLSHRLLVFIGLVSYSFYLWHWPVTVYTKMLWDTDAARYFIMLFSLLLAVLSYAFIERRYRGGSSRLPRLRGFGELTGMGVMLGAAAVFIFFGGGLAERLPVQIRALAAANAGVEQGGMPCREFTENEAGEAGRKGEVCRLGREDVEPSFVVWGDSHAHAIAYALHLAALDVGIGGYVLSNGGCCPLLGVTRPHKSKCQSFNDAALAFIRGQPALRHVLLAGYWRIPLTSQGYDNSNVLLMDAQTSFVSPVENKAVFRRGLARTLTALQDYRVSIIEDVPEVGAQFGKAVANHLVREAWLGGGDMARRSFHDEDSRYEAEMAEVLAGLPPGWEYVEIKPRLCKGRFCPLVLEGGLVYFDGDHLSRHGAALLAPLFREVLRADERAALQGKTALRPGRG